MPVKPVPVKSRCMLPSSSQMESPTRRDSAEMDERAAPLLGEVAAQGRPSRIKGWLKLLACCSSTLAVAFFLLGSVSPLAVREALQQGVRRSTAVVHLPMRFTCTAMHLWRGYGGIAWTVSFPRPKRRMLWTENGGLRALRQSPLWGCMRVYTCMLRQHPKQHRRGRVNTNVHQCPA